LTFSPQFGDDGSFIPQRTQVRDPVDEIVESLSSLVHRAETRINASRYQFVTDRVAERICFVTTHAAAREELLGQRNESRPLTGDRLP
jgi:hypothetical protein